MKPIYWFHENVWASRPWLNQIFGPPIVLLPGHAIWGNRRVLFPNIAPHKGSAQGKRWGEFGVGSGGSRIAAERRNTAEIAKIPYEIGETICRAVESIIDRALR
jgi:hypothetical protein